MSRDECRSEDLRYRSQKAKVLCLITKIHIVAFRYPTRHHILVDIGHISVAVKMLDVGVGKEEELQDSSIYSGQIDSGAVTSLEVAVTDFSDARATISNSGPTFHDLSTPINHLPRSPCVNFGVRSSHSRKEKVSIKSISRKEYSAMATPDDELLLIVRHSITSTMTALISTAPSQPPQRSSDLW